MKLLILGGVKFVGKELLRQAIEKNNEITLISLDEPTSLEFITWINVDRNDEPALTEALKDKEFDCVIDNIAFNGHHVRKLLNALNGRTKRYVLTSSVDTYLHSQLKLADEVIDKNLTIEEVNDNTPRWLNYAIGKRAAERVLRNDTSLIEKVIVRPAAVVGADDNVHQHNVPRGLIWPSKLIDNEPVLLFENEMDIYSLVHVNDVATALLLLAKHPKAVNQVYNVCGDTVWNHEIFVTKLIEYSGSKSKIIKVYLKQLEDSGVFEDKITIPRSYGAGPIHRYPLFDNSRIKELGWKPSSDKDMLLSLISNNEKILKIKEQLQPYRNKELEFIKTLDIKNDSNDDYITGYCNVPLSKIAIGTHRGEQGQEVSDEYKQAIKKSVLNGINVIDTAINYRITESEIAVGEAIKELVDAKSIERSDVFIITKGGFPAKAYRWNLHSQNEIENKHAIRPGYIKHCLNVSYKNLKLKTIDLYMLHNPEIALNYMSQEEFYETMLQNFVMLEDEVRLGRIRGYGFATWHGFRINPTNKNYLNLNRILEIAKIAAGHKPHNFMGIELPINILMNEAIVYANQMYKGELMPVIKVAKEHNLKVFTSKSVMYGESNDNINSHYNFDYGLTTPQKSLLFLKSIPEITSAIVGMKKLSNVDSAIEVANHFNLTQEQLDYTVNKCQFKRLF